MTHPLFDFKFLREGELYCATWSPIEGEVFAPYWSGLWEIEYGTDRDSNPWVAYAINNGFGEAGLAVRLLTWALTDGFERAVVPNFYRDETAKELARSVESTDFVRWQYEVGCDYRDPARGDVGFVPGRACVPIRPTPTAFEKAHASEAGVFRISSFDELTKINLAVSGDASSEVTVYGLGSGEQRYRDLLAALRTDARPELRELLVDDEIFVHAGMDHDGFGLSSVIVRSRTDFEGRLIDASGRIASAFDAYVAGVASVTTWPQWFGLIRAMERASINEEY